ncbi:Ferrochelatase, protoheme ferro-lyase [Fulvivirga imtechensis AK7]|uniref:Ferrochelatase n=1 Tax=Fulvivirga imtechensis AK7 TaxID=1237149 RepID=L8JHV3_9BACT|nr:ferrochelatase [Fulvivirga imtechensis]ELR68446.1 Ferrochelatase, protoheme ferro-lyase [Fulvivirga imtechensis AK7]
MNTVKGKTGVLLINLGTPDSPSVGDVRSYLSQFLNDPRVIDIPWLLRKMLVNLIIVPFRAPKSAKVYKLVWTENGSPLLYYSEKVRELLDNALGGDYTVHLAMRYKNPSIPAVLEEMRKLNYTRIVVLPMFPQYASASTGSALDEVMRVIRKWWVIPELKIISQYYDHPKFIDGIVERATKYNLNDYDHILFSYHGLPVRQVDKVYNDGLCSDRDCEHTITQENQYCYKATCYATTRLIAERLNLDESRYTVCFQSRLDKEWLEPFSDKVVEQKAKEGAKKLLVFSPAFTADCLETIIEIGEEYQEIFEKHGGEKVQLVESLNDSPIWVECLKELVEGK